MSEPEKQSSAQVEALPPKPEPSISMEAFLVGEPIHSRKLVRNVISRSPANGWISIIYPDDIRAQCDHDHCEGIRRHAKHSDDRYILGDFYFCYVCYQCTNCRSLVKIFALKIEKSVSTAYCTKLYQEPSFGQPIPKRLFRVIGEDNREYFLQARRAIARSLGVGAYAYYRRIVENNKFELIESVLEVSKATNASPDQIALLERAQRETQFSKALDMLQDVTAIPPVLLIEGHNPLALLHDLLSEGIHQLTDAECLERAKEAEIILSEIAERMQVVLIERKAVKSAISSIMNRKNVVKASPQDVEVKTKPH